MLEELKGKKHIFFDVGYTLDRPASGDWYFTNRFNEIAGERIARCGEEEIRRARAEAGKYAAAHHKVREVDEEIDCLTRYYAIVSEVLGLGLTDVEARDIARDRATNMDNYIPYPKLPQILEILSNVYSLGIISDTWPSIIDQLRAIGALPYFTSFTFSCDFGVFKPDRILYEDALMKCGEKAENTVFIDDSLTNLKGAAALGITPVLIAANPASDVETEYAKIYRLEDLFR